MTLKLVVLLGALLAALSLAAGCATWNVERTYPPVGAVTTIDGDEIHYVDNALDSDLPPVILIHGATVNARDMLMSLGEPLMRERRVVTVDRPGRGYSERGEKGYRLANQAARIKALGDALEIEDPIVIGQSFGGAVALRYAIDYQDEIAGLMVLAPVSHEWPGGVAWYNHVAGWPIVGFLVRRFIIPLYGPVAVRGGVDASFEPDAPPKDYVARAGLPLLFRASDFGANAQDLRRLKEQIIEMSPDYGQLTTPMTIVVGADDPTVSPMLHARQLARDVRHAELVVLEDTGHALHHAETMRILEALAALDAEIARRAAMN